MTGFPEKSTEVWQVRKPCRAESKRREELRRSLQNFGHLSAALITQTQSHSQRKMEFGRILTESWPFW